MLVLPADCVAELQEVRRLLGLREVRLVTEFELAQLFPELRPLRHAAVSELF
jgi:hypothetical protein